MEKYTEFLDRINNFEKDNMEIINVLKNGYFYVNPQLTKKIDQNNHFSEFYGDTVVFDLEDSVKNTFVNIVNKLYETVPECFCEILIPDTFHLTLHDLSNAVTINEIAEETFENEIKLKKRLKSLKIDDEPIKMKAKNIFNMVNTSLVFGFFPADEKEYIKLMNLYETVDFIKKLTYPFTPHVTLGYYNINGFSEQSARKLELAVNEINKNKFQIELNPKKLIYQKFTNMNDYINIFNLIKT